MMDEEKENLERAKSGTIRFITNFLVGIEQNIVKGLINECKEERIKFAYPFLCSIQMLNFHQCH